MRKSAEILLTQQMTIGYKQGNKVRKVLQNLNLSLYRGELVCLIGPNGAGKSTLLRSIAGLLPVINGMVLVEDKPSGMYSSTELAKKISLVLSGSQGVNLKIEELVEMGRIPYTGWLGKLSEADDEMVHNALEITGTQKFRNRNFQQLSDGEKQRVMLARALAQDTPVLLLDEPTAHLDIPSRMEMMLLLQHLAHVMNKAILLSTHDLHLALEMADRIWLLTDDGNIHTGLPEELLMDESFQKAFHKEGFQFDSETGHFRVKSRQTGMSLKVSGDKNTVYWTRKALVRKGFTLDQEEPEGVITIDGKDEHSVWVVEAKSGFSQQFYSLETLLAGLTEYAEQSLPV